MLGVTAARGRCSAQSAPGSGGPAPARRRCRRRSHPGRAWVQDSDHLGAIEHQVELLRYLVVEDCGELINPAVVEGQIRGGVAQGIGAVLLERSAYDEWGQYLSSTFMDYLLPTTTDVPNIEIHHLETVPLDQDVNFRGVGEGGMIVAPPTICNAVADAIAPTGGRVLEQHLPPQRILELMGAIPERG